MISIFQAVRGISKEWQTKELSHREFTITAPEILQNPDWISDNQFVNPTMNNTITMAWLRCTSFTMNRLSTSVLDQLLLKRADVLFFQTLCNIRSLRLRYNALILRCLRIFFLLVITISWQIHRVPVTEKFWYSFWLIHLLEYCQQQMYHRNKSHGSKMELIRTKHHYLQKLCIKLWVCWNGRWLWRKLRNIEIAWWMKESISLISLILIILNDRSTFASIK